LSGNVAVVIPAFNAATTIVNTIQSALQPQVEQVIIVDDGSTDKTAEIIREIASTTSRIHAVFRPTSGGPAQARNDGLAAATSEFILFLDSDDVLQPNAIASLQQAMGPTSAAVLGRFTAVDIFDRPVDIGTWSTVQLQPVLRRGGRFVPTMELSGEALLTRLVVPPPGGILIRRAAAMVSGGYDVSLRRSEDIAFLVSLAREGELTLCPAEVLRYRRNPQQRSQATSARQRGRQRALILIIWRAPTRAERWSLARGASAHHRDRASVRWREGSHRWPDAAVAVRSLLLAALFRIVGALSLVR
jgi:glycosyltransferase involved in cell wall biosynthesis